MTKFFLVVLAFILTLSAIQFVPKTFAVDVIKPACKDLTAEQKKNTICSDNATTDDNPLFGPDGILTNIVQVLTIFVGIASVITIIVSGLRMVLSSGDSNTINVSRNAIFYAIIGLVVTAASQILISFVLNNLKI